MGTILITGFTPFGPHARNPSGEIAAALDGALLGDYEVVGRVLPVTWAEAWPALAEAVAEVQPEAIILTGVAPTGRWRLERTARNLTGGQLDVEGVPAQGQITPDGPVERKSTLPFEQALARLKVETLPAPVVCSDDAGTYLCNFTLYRALERLERPVGFVHLPPLRTEEMPDGLSFEAIEQGTRTVLTAVAEALAS